MLYDKREGMNQIFQSFQSLYNSQNQHVAGTSHIFNADDSDADDEREQGQVMDMICATVFYRNFLSH